MEVEHILREFGLILGAGLVAQFLATFLRIPEMIVLVAAGALIGPSVLGLVENPLNGVGAQLIFTVGVAMILFHGGGGDLTARYLEDVRGPRDARLARRAVASILLAEGVEGAEIAASLVALAVATLLLQATTAGWLARRLGLIEEHQTETPG
jgi:NhaP-type Na+/H+ or K+/H+ antiporter